jgi:predicted dehydrogenase
MYDFEIIALAIQGESFGIDGENYLVKKLIQIIPMIFPILSTEVILKENKMVKIGFGVIGTGMWGEAHARIYSSHPYTSLIAVCDIMEDRAKNIAKKYGAGEYYTDYNEMLKNPGIDAVGIATPDFAHCDPFVAACEAGKNILIEKPLATTYDDLKKMKKAYRENKVRVMVDFHNRWNPPYTIAKESINANEIGTLISMYYRINNPIWVPTEMLSWPDKSSVLWFLGSHAVDTLRFLSDSEVKRIYSVSRSEVLVKRGIPVADIYQSIFEFEDGIIATIENCWILPRTNPHWNDIKLNILGSDGMYNMDLTHNQAIERFLKDKSDHPDIIIMPTVHGKPSGYAYESIRDFIERLYSEEDFIVDFNDGYKVSKVILSIIKSAELREPMEVDYS